MEQKPIKRNEHIVPLSKDHHFTLLFCWKIKQGLKLDVDTERIKKYVAYFWQKNMQLHFREEEDFLFAPVKDENVQRAIAEHRQIKQQIDEVLSAPNEETASHLLMLADVVEKHVRYEERELFPHLEKTLTPEQLETIGKQLDQVPALLDDYEDEFWIKKN